MATSEELKALVREKYGEIAGQTRENNASSCCGSGACSSMDYTIFSEDYSTLDGYHPEADLGLGCGIPTQYTMIRAGETVVDLGSGAGNDCFVARSFVGPTGKVIGLDMTPAMIDKARENADKLGFNNVEFRLGEIEAMPIGGFRADVVISNCVLNLVPDKEKAFSEIWRILKPGGRLAISDVVLQGELPESLREAAEMYAGCVSGAIQKLEYLGILERQGFSAIRVASEKEVVLPDDILSAYLSPEEQGRFRTSGAGILSVTVLAEKPASTCMPGSGCC